MMSLTLTLVCLTVASHAGAEINRLSADLLANARAHHTELYKLAQQSLIVRRGGDVALTVEGKGEAKTLLAVIKLNDELIASFVLGDKRDVDKKLNWTSTIDKIDENHEAGEFKVNFRLHVPVRSPVGQFNISIHEDGEEGHDLVQQAYILFNPWNTEDETYMISRSERDEYVLNELGTVYTGWHGKDWVFGQFHENVLPAVMMLLSTIPVLQNNTSILSDPVLLSRAISAGVNANDGFGVVVGNWGGYFDGGIPPSYWSSSVDILEKYYTSGGESVKYGQCWVFGAVTTTVLRALGIPARSVTTLGSAHDTDDSLTIDTFYDEEMNEIDGTYGSDSIWNFHSWTEAWMARHDIPGRAAGGWQVVDATPQELSDGIFQAGPASVAGIKRGDIDSNFDMHFVFAEVSSMEVKWKLDPNEPLGWRRLSIDGDSVGTGILTKPVGSNSEDITSNYKYKDPKERRFSLMNAAKRAGVEVLIHDTIVTEGVEFTLSPFKVTNIGESISGHVKIVSTLNHTVSVNAKIRIDSTFYNDVKVNRIATVGRIVELAPGATELVPFDIPFEDYYTKLVDHCLVAISATAIVTETDQIWVKDADLTLKSPPVSISLVGDAVEGQVNDFKVVFRNPLPIPLTECDLRVHGTRQYMKLSLPNIDPGETVEYEVDISIDHVPLVVADIECDEVTGMTGSTIVTFSA